MTSTINFNTLPAISTARLPVVYEQAVSALAACEKLDECKDWADKSAALASYAKQAKDESLYKMSIRIQARANRRVSELLKAIPAAKNQHDANAVKGISRKQAAEEAGLRASGN